MDPSRTKFGRFCLAAWAIVFGASAAACGTDRATVSGQEGPPPVTIASSDMVTVAWGTLERGPVISGRVTPELQATERAEVGGSVIAVHADVGEFVTRRQVLARLDDNALRDQLLSARLSVSSARTALTTARRDADRLETLREAGAVSAQQTESARQAAAAAEAQLGDARARLALAEDQLGHTVVRAPITGTISERPVNTTDHAVRASRNGVRPSRNASASAPAPVISTNTMTIQTTIGNERPGDTVNAPNAIARHRDRTLRRLSPLLVHTPIQCKAGTTFGGRRLEAPN